MIAGLVPFEQVADFPLWHSFRQPAPPVACCSARARRSIFVAFPPPCPPSTFWQRQLCLAELVLWPVFELLCHSFPSGPATDLSASVSSSLRLLLTNTTNRKAPTEGRRGGGGCILLVGLDVADLATIGTLAGCSCGHLSFAAVSARGPGVASAGFVVQLFLLLSCLSPSLVLLESFEFLLDSRGCQWDPSSIVHNSIIPNARKTIVVGIARRSGAVDTVERYM